MALVGIAGKQVESLTRINVGCGYDKRPGYLNVGMDPNCTPDTLVTDVGFSNCREKPLMSLFWQLASRSSNSRRGRDGCFDWKRARSPMGMLF